MSTPSSSSIDSPKYILVRLPGARFCEYTIWRQRSYHDTIEKLRWMLIDSYPNLHQREIQIRADLPYSTASVIVSPELWPHVYGDLRAIELVLSNIQPPSPSIGDLKIEGNDWALCAHSSVIDRSAVDRANDRPVLDNEQQAAMNRASLEVPFADEDPVLDENMDHHHGVHARAGKKLGTFKESATRQTREEFVQGSSSRPAPPAAISIPVRKSTVKRPTPARGCGYGHGDEPGYPTLTAHLELERSWTESSRSGEPWVVPPKSLHTYITKFIEDGTGRNWKEYRLRLDENQRMWVARHRPKTSTGKVLRMIAPGEDLHVSLMRAHKKSNRGHATFSTTWSKLRTVYMGPSRSFVQRWVALCPTCNPK